MATNPDLTSIPALDPARLSRAIAAALVSELERLSTEEGGGIDGQHDAGRQGLEVGTETPVHDAA